MKIGGKGKTVKLDHTFSTHRAKYDRGDNAARKPDEKAKALGGCFCVESGVVTFDTVPNLTRICTNYVVKSRVLPETRIGTL